MRQAIIILISFLCVTSCESDKKENLISGNIKNHSDSKVTINIPIDGKFFEGNNLEIPIDSLGNYSLMLPNNTNGIVSVTNHFSSAFIFWKDKENHIINFDNQKVIYESGDEKMNDLLEKLELLSDARNIVDAKKYTDIESKNAYYSNLLNEKLAILDDARKKSLISEVIYEKLKKMVHLKIADFKSTDYFFTFRFFYENFPEKRKEFIETYLPQWEKIYSEAFLNTEFSAYYDQSSFLSRYRMMHDIKRTGNLRFDFSEPYFISEINFLRENLPQELVEYAWANTAYQGIMQKEFEKEWIENFEDFKKEFPNSKLTVLLKPYIDEIIKYNENTAKSVSFVDNYQNINSLDELFAQFRGKVLYVDIWATWCVPCRKELQYSMENHPTLEEMGVLPIYLSIDKNDEIWVEMTRNLGLKGLHIRANESLAKEVGDIVQEIPYYIIVGKEGEKIWKAKRPSDKQELFNQLKDFL